MTPDGQVTLDEVLALEPSPALIQADASSPDSFGCCSKYRECSDAKQCLISNRDYSARCLYRYISDLSAVGLFEFRAIDAEFPKLCSHRSFLKPAVTSHPEYGPLFRQAQAERNRDKHNRSVTAKIPKAGSKEFLLYWLDHDGVALRDLLSEPYRFAFLPTANIMYAEELYHYTLFSGYVDRIYPMSPFAEDGLLSPAVFAEEESRRLKLSRGYSQAEKEQRLAEIQEVCRTVKLFAIAG